MMPIQSMVKRTQQAKMNSAIAIIALNIARQKKDINALKASRARKMLLNARATILARYGNMARQEYMQNLGKIDHSK